MKKASSLKKIEIIRSINNIYKINLKVKKTEKVLIFTDGYTRQLSKIGKLIKEVGKKFTSNIKYIEYKPTGCHGMEPPEEAWKEAFGNMVCNKLKKKKLLKQLIDKRDLGKKEKEIEKIIKRHKDDACDVVIALSHFSTSHTRFRDYLNRICGVRYASLPLFDMKMFEGAMRENWIQLKKRTEKIARIVNKAERIEVETTNGTFLEFSKKGRKALSDTGIITTPGTFSNLPAGEVFLAPIEGTANGKLILEWAPTRKLKKPVTLNIEKGMVSSVTGNEKYIEFLKKKIGEKRENSNIAELGIGTNNRALRPDNILESEKISGTIHIALGDNSAFGGKVSTPFHQDFVFFKPTVTLIYKGGKRKVLLKNGKMKLKR